MSFRINFEPTEQEMQPNGIITQMFGLGVVNSSPEFARNLRYRTLLCAQSNQISGMNNEDREQDLNLGFDNADENSCRLCNDLSTVHIPDGIQPVVRGFLRDWEASADAGCKICGLVLLAVMPCQEPARIKAYVRPGAALNVIIKSPDKNARYDIFTRLGYNHSPWPGLGSARTISKIGSDEKLVDVIKSWLADCIFHPRCRAPSPSILPKRVIGVRGDEIKLEELGPLSQPYIALSHCWGTGIVPKLTKSTLSSFKDSIPWDSLTQTFRDAVILTRKLGVDYIWIDSLCIIQDDEEDWRIEAAKMANVYENAYLVISATAAKDGADGLFRPRKPVQILASIDAKDHCIVREYGSQHRVWTDPDTEEDPVRYIIRDTARHAQWDPFELIAESADEFNPLLGRAWAFQERLLATRIVHFADHELVWECKQTQRCECMHLDRSDGRPIMERSTRDIKLQFSMATTDASLHSDADPYQLWASIVEKYTERSLSFERDRLPALAGAIRQMQKLDLGPCVGGIFLREIPRCLLWVLGEPGVRPQVYTAPSWSWASVELVEREDTKLRSGRPPRVQYSWNKFTEGSGRYEDYIEESCIEGRWGLDWEMVSSEDQKPLFRVDAIKFRARVIKAAFTIKVFDTPEMPMAYRAIIYNRPAQTSEYYVSRDAQDQSFRSDLLLHTDQHKLVSGSEVFLAAVARRVGEERPDNMLVLKRLESQSDFACYAGLRVFPANEMDTPAYARIGVITKMEEETKAWVDDAEMETVVMF